MLFVSKTFESLQCILNVASKIYYSTTYIPSTVSFSSLLYSSGLLRSFESSLSSCFCSLFDSFSSNCTESLFSSCDAMAVYLVLYIKEKHEYTYLKCLSLAAYIKPNPNTNFMDTALCWVQAYQSKMVWENK